MGVGVGGEGGGGGGQEILKFKIYMSLVRCLTSSCRCVPT